MFKNMDQVSGESSKHRKPIRSMEKTEIKSKSHPRTSTPILERKMCMPDYDEHFKNWCHKLEHCAEVNIVKGLHVPDSVECSIISGHFVLSNEIHQQKIEDINERLTFQDNTHSKNLKEPSRNIKNKIMDLFEKMNISDALKSFMCKSRIARNRNGRRSSRGKGSKNDPHKNPYVIL